MVTPPFLLRSISPRPPDWHRWVLNLLYNFDLYTIDDWVGLMGDHLQRPGGATAMQTARYTVDALGHITALISAIRTLSTYGDPAAQSSLTDAAIDLEDALEKLCEARDELLKSVGAERITWSD
jgi:hypothetical protein